MVEMSFGRESAQQQKMFRPTKLSPASGNSFISSTCFSSLFPELFFEKLSSILFFHPTLPRLRLRLLQLQFDLWLLEDLHDRSDATLLTDLLRSLLLIFESLSSILPSQPTLPRLKLRPRLQLRFDLWLLDDLLDRSVATLPVSVIRVRLLPRLPVDLWLLEDLVGRSAATLPASMFRM